MEFQTLGELVRELRTRLDIGLREFARIIGDAPSSVLSIERNRRGHWKNRAKLEKVADALGIDPLHEHYGEFWILAGQMDRKIAQAISNNDRHLVPALLRTVDDCNLNDEELKELIAFAEQLGNRNGGPSGHRESDKP